MAHDTSLASLFPQLIADYKDIVASLIVDDYWVIPQFLPAELRRHILAGSLWKPNSAQQDQVLLASVEFRAMLFKLDL